MTSDNPLAPPSGRIFLKAVVRLVAFFAFAYLFRPVAPGEPTGVAATLRACERERDLLRTRRDQYDLPTLRALRESSENVAAQTEKRLEGECGGTPAAGCRALLALGACQRSNAETLREAVGRRQGPDARRAR